MKSKKDTSDYIQQKNVLLQIENGNHSIAGWLVQQEESPGNIESPYFLTGRYFIKVTASATENYRCICSKGENVR